MHIYGAQLQAKPGRGGELSAALGQLRDVVSAATGRSAWVWAIAAGAPTGSFAVSTRLDGTGDLIDTLMKLNTNDEYLKLSGTVGDLVATPTQTNWMQVIGTAGDVGEPKPVTVVTTATVAAGHVSEAMAWSTQMMEFAAGATGMGTILATASAGSFFDIAWIGGADSGAAVDDANAALMADPDYLARMDQAGGLFVDGSATRTVMVQLP